MEAGKRAEPTIGFLVEVWPPRGFADHTEAAGPFHGLGTSGRAGRVEKHARVFGGTMWAVEEGGGAGREGGVMGVGYFGGVGREGGVGAVVVAEDCGVGVFGGVGLESGGDGGEELVGRYDEGCVSYCETVF